MKKYLLYFLPFFFALPAKAQVYKLFINSRDEICDSAKAKAFILYSAGSDSLWHAREFFMNGRLRLKGTYKDQNLQTAHGLFTYYHTEDSTYYRSSVGTFINGEKEGIWTDYYPNSSIKLVVNYKNGKRNGEYRLYFSNGEKINIRGNYSDGLADGEWTTFDKSENATKTDLWKKNKLVSTKQHPLVYRKPRISAKFDTYIQSLFKSVSDGPEQTEGVFLIVAALGPDGTLSNISMLATFSEAAGLEKKVLEMIAQSPAWEPAYNEKEKKPVKDSVAFVIRYSKYGVNTELHSSAIRRETTNKNLFEITPMPQGGWDRFFGRIQTLFTWPPDDKNTTEDVQNTNITGTIFLSFAVEPDGSLSEFKVIRGLDSSINEAVLRAVKRASPKWFPGIQDNKMVRVSYTIPIKFHQRAIVPKINWQSQDE